MSNSATNSAVEIQIQNSNLSCDGLTSFVGNLADLGGGISGSGGNQVEFRGNPSFTHNIALHGGGLFVDHDEVSANGYTRLANNFASEGGGLRAQDNTVIFEGLTTFVNNSAAENSGGILIQGSRLSLEGLISFVNNLGITQQQY